MVEYYYHLHSMNLLSAKQHFIVFGQPRSVLAYFTKLLNSAYNKSCLLPISIELRDESARSDFI